MLRLVAPGADAFIAEKYAFEIERVLGNWARELTSHKKLSLSALPMFHGAMRGSSLHPANERVIREAYGVTAKRREYAPDLKLGRKAFLQELGAYLSSLGAIGIAEFQITGIHVLSNEPLRVEADIRYTLVAERGTSGREQRVGGWRTEWLQPRVGEWQAAKWQAADESLSSSKSPMFRDVSAQAFGSLSSYKQQLLRGADYWRTVLDGASGIDIYGNQGIAAGDYDGDDYDDLYICQPAGLPNRLYRNRHDGTFEDVTAQAGVDVLDPTSCALFADFENRGLQDLLVVTSGGPLLFINDGHGRFAVKRDAFRFPNLPQGTFTHAAIADYDHDGRLDVYFCLYNYYAGLDQYRYPSPYFDARNGPPNFLFHNEGGWRFEDRTEAAGLNVDNNRYSFACAWGDMNGDGWPDLYVANDFGRSNLYRNNGDGTFTSVATKAAVEDVGAGMSACWLDFDGDGKQDIYVANMWSAAGLRVSKQANFHRDDSEDVHALYRRHARGNSLYQNQGNGKFRNVAAESGAEFGRWAWSSDSWDFDHDGYPDLYIANGYVSGYDRTDVSSFFWRQVVGNSPRDLTPAANYEHGWNAINELIRSDRSWSGEERNVLYWNNRDGSFSDISGVSGMDFPDDARAFALADLEHDGRLEVLVKNRNAPQLRLLRNVMPEIGNSVVFRLQGTRSSRDAIGTAVTIEARGRRQTKYLQAGSGFLSQHSKELFFGVGEASDIVQVTVHWPSGLVQVFERVPVNHRVELTEASNQFRSEPFSTAAPSVEPTTQRAASDAVPLSVATWLLQPLRAPGFSLSDTSGKRWDLHATRGKKLLTFWSTASELSRQQLRSLGKQKWAAAQLQLFAVNVDDIQDKAAIASFANEAKLGFPVLLATPDVTGIYNIVYRYLFDRHRNLGLPTSFLVDESGMILKVYQGEVHAEQINSDIAISSNTAERRKQALPFPGTLHLGSFQRNDFTYGVAFFQRGYLDAAADAFSQVIAAKPDDAEAHYNLGTLYLRRNKLAEAQAQLEKTVELKPNHSEAWNNLGMLAAEQGDMQEAAQDFKQSLSFRPNYAVALVNLGNVYRRERQFADAEELLNRAVQLQPDNAEANYSLAMLFAQQNEVPQAEQGFERAIALRPGYPDALNNFGVLLVRERRYSDAEKKFQACMRSDPNFDQAYLNLARLYVLLNERDKAREVLNALLRRNPQHPLAQQALKMLQ